ncbi:MAG TPA: type IV pilus assembly protein PilM [Nitrospinaceae bacterium]|nr:type IV pilus assembly protein PilM [Nitrospinaceae bacterium]
MFLNKKTPLVAVDINSNSVMVAQLNTVNGKPELMSLGVMPLEEGSVVSGVIGKPSKVIDALRLLLKTEKIKCRHAVTSVWDPIIRKIKMPTVPEKELPKKIYELAEQHIPFDIKKMLIDYKITEQAQIEKNEESLGKTNYFIQDAMEVLLVAISKEIVNDRLDILIEAGLNPVIVDMDIFASINALKLIRDLPATGLVVLLDLANPVSRINILSNGNFLFLQDDPVAIDFQSYRDVPPPNPLLALSKKIKKNNIIKNLNEDSFLQKGISEKQLLDEEIAEKLFIDGVLEKMETIFTLIDQKTSEQIEHIFLFGDGALISDLDSMLADHFSTRVEIVNPFKSISVSSKHFNLETLNRLGPLLTTVVGLALRRFNYN